MGEDLGRARQSDAGGSCGGDSRATEISVRDYSKVSAQFWTGKTGKALRGDMQAQIIAMYLMTSPHSNMIGVFTCPILYMAHETGSPMEGATKGLQTLCEGGFCTYDDDSETVWVHEMAKFQVDDELKPGDKRVAGIRKQYDAMPEGRIKDGFFEKYQGAFHLVNAKPLASPLQAPTKPGTGTETEKSKPSVASDADDPENNEAVTGIPNCPQQKLLALYAELLPTLTQPRIWEGARADAMRARWKQCAVPGGASKGYATEDEGLRYWRKFFAYVAAAPKLTNGIARADGSAWQPDLPWLLKAENFAKVIEGKFHTEAA